MKWNSKRAWKVALAFLMLGVTVWYLAEVVTPFDEEIKVYNVAGVAPERIDMLIEHAKELGCFDEELVEKLRGESKWTPWDRAVIFIYIGGTPDKVDVMAGFQGGPVYGGGRVFDAVWNRSAWEFSNASWWRS